MDWLSIKDQLLCIVFLSPVDLNLIHSILFAFGSSGLHVVAFIVETVRHLARLASIDGRWSCCSKRLEVNHPRLDMTITCKLPKRCLSLAPAVESTVGSTIGKT